MTDCKHTIKPGETRVWTGESKSPPYACGLCEMERLRSCADALSAQLASMTKRAEEALALVHSAEELHDACLARCLDAEAKLAAAVEGLKAVVDAGHENGNYCNTKMAYRQPCDCVVAVVEDTLRALGIDPSKERGK